MASIPRPGTTPGSQDGSVLVSPGFRTGVNVTFSLGPQLTWDGYCRLLYDRINAGIQAQANALLSRGNITPGEARFLVESQRNELLRQFRNRLSPFGRLYSEILKPSSKLPTLEGLVQQKGSIEGVLKSVGKTRQIVDRIGLVSRVAGPVLIVVQVTMIAVVVWKAPPEERGRVASREVGGAVGAASFGAAGAWAGCVAAASLASPSLVVPVWGEVSEGGACLVGGIFGSLGLGWFGSGLGQTAGENIYSFATQMTWTRP
jgi:hypothetical protein